MLLNFWGYGLKEWLLLAILIPAYCVLHALYFRFFSSELNRPDMATSFSMVATRWTCGLFALIAFAALLTFFSSVEKHASLSDAINATRSGITRAPDSALIAMGLQAETLLDGLKIYLSSDSEKFDARLPLVLGTINGILIFLTACASLSCFSIPKKEFRRVLGPISSSPEYPLLSPLRIAGISAIATFFVLFVYIPSFAKLEYYLSNRSTVSDAIAKLQVAVEQIDGRYYQAGTLEKVRLAQLEVLKKYQGTRQLIVAMIRTDIEHQFDKAEGNVDSYLDWYYSLLAEYMRIGKMLTGQLEDYLASEMKKYLDKNIEWGPVREKFQQLEALEPLFRKDLTTATQAILDANQVTVPMDAIRIHAKASLEGLLNPSFQEHISFDSRIKASVGVLSIGAAATAYIVSKGVIKAAAKALAKVIASKATGSAIGTIVGGLLGSIIPGAGTAAGGAVGAVIGGVVVDAGLLKLEEAMDRERFKEQIISGIREAKARTLDWKPNL